MILVVREQYVPPHAAIARRRLGCPYLHRRHRPRVPGAAHSGAAPDGPHAGFAVALPIVTREDEPAVKNRARC
jgi:hypothetical protein